jgi:EAL domain-containing protein (putative c-di-GMP-specific phosphodiesterase class I)
MCHTLGIPVILENVETADELEIVKSLDIDYGQGYYFSKPLPADDFLKSDRFVMSNSGRRRTGEMARAALQPAAR